jgi:hypothetical protein
MPSSYTTNLGIELPADGEQDGIWGDVVNENMNILDRAINGSLSLSLSGTTSTLTTSDGILSNGQYKALILGGSPSGTHTITISPNDAQKIYFVYNTTAQSVVFTQGSGGNVTIAAGDSGVIYSNGGGGAAAVVNLTDHFAMSSVKITGGAISGVTITGITDLAVADGGTGASTAAQALINLGLTATATELNYSSGVTSAIQTQLNTKAPLASPALTGVPTAPTAANGTSTTQIATTAFVQSAMPAGFIGLWAGSVASIPSGWALCNGANGTPDLRDRFVVGAGSTYAVGATGGQNAITSVPAHTHDVGNLANATTGAHTHSVSGNTSTTGAHTHNTSGTTSNTGAHTHNGTTANAGTHAHNGGTSTNGAHTHSLAQTQGSDGNATGLSVSQLTNGRNYNIITGGNGSVISAGDHSHNFTTANAGDHAHNFGTSSDGAHSHNTTGTAASAGDHSHTVSGTAASAGDHSHTISGSTASAGSASVDVRPPYYALCYIMKL